MKDLNSALLTALQGILPYPVKHQAKLFTPPENKEWIEIINIPTRTEVLQTVEKLTGILQIDINYPLNTGIYQILKDADKVRARLKPHSRFEYNNQSFTVRKTELSQIFTKGNYDVIHLSIYYQTTINI